MKIKFLGYSHESSDEESSEEENEQSLPPTPPNEQSNCESSSVLYFVKLQVSTNYFIT